MDFNNIPIMEALKKRMHWLNTNQKVLSENVSNADTPGFKAKGLKEQDFSSLIDDLSSTKARGGSSVNMRTTKPGHIDLSKGSDGAYRAQELKGQEESPTGNTVVLEEEMMKVADNQMKYGLVVNLYKKNMGLLKMAMGKGGNR